jgi:hypothetical protein
MAVCRFAGPDTGFIHNPATRLPLCLRNANVLLAHIGESEDACEDASEDCSLLLLRFIDDIVLCKKTMALWR